MMRQENVPETSSLKVLHAGSLTSLVRQGLGPALSQAHGIVVESEPGHSVALATAIKEGRLRGDLYLSADAEVNRLLLGPANGAWIGWFMGFARNAVVLAYSPKSRFLTDFEQARSGAIPWYQLLPDEINLGNPALAATYAQVHFTTNTGQTFSGKPISFSAAVLNNASHPHAALQFVEYLLSPPGQQLVQAAHFLPGPALVGGDASSVPPHLRTLLQGDYRYPG